MFLGPWKDVWTLLRAHNPGSPFKKRHLSFITIHYIYMLSLTMIGSILLFPAGGLNYIDALFFASGSATQSGLNTVDVNLLHTYQQVVIYMIAMVANPIFINTFVVFIRLYWFEKRFQHIVQEARNFRRTRSRSRADVRVQAEDYTRKEERGVDGRKIVVLHGNGEPIGPMLLKSSSHDHTGAMASGKKLHILDTQTSNSRSSDLNQKEFAPDSAPPRKPSFTRDIKFADEVTPTSHAGQNRASLERYATFETSTEQQIGFLEKQRNPKDTEPLRIPGPREFDRGELPKEMIHNRERQSSVRSSTSDGNDGGEAAGGDRLDGCLDARPGEQDVLKDCSDGSHKDQHNASLPFSNLTLRKSASRNVAPETVRKTPSVPRLRSRSGTLSRSSTRERDMPYLSWQPTVGRNSAFINLSEAQREELGGIEYRALKTLAIVLVSYFLFWHLFGVVTFTPWIIRTNTWGQVVDADGQSRPWWGIFTSASLFNDLGFTLTPDSMISFQTAILPLFIGSFLIVIGNTGFPCLLRFTIWALTRLVPVDGSLWEELKFLLDHPRRCFTLLFPSDATWWLFWILVLLNGIDLLFFIILDLNDPTVTGIAPGYRVLDGLFQAASTRTAGTAIVNIANLHPGIQVSYLIMMYISAFPIAISVRRTNVYEEKSLGIYGSAFEDAEDDKEPSYVGAHLRRQLSFDLWFIFLGLFIVAIAEASRLQDPNDNAFTLFACLFEIVSAYGTVGLSLGYPTINASFSTEFGAVSKLVIIAMQIRGRHRGLPYELDRAILLPSESLHSREDQDAAKRVQRRLSNFSVSDPARAHAELSSDNLANMRSQTETEVSESHRSHAREGLGRMMAGLASGSAILKEETEWRKARPDDTGAVMSV